MVPTLPDGRWERTKLAFYGGLGAAFGFVIALAVWDDRAGFLQWTPGEKLSFLVASVVVSLISWKVVDPLRADIEGTPENRRITSLKRVLSVAIFAFGIPTLFELFQHTLSEKGVALLAGGLPFAVLNGLITYAWAVGARLRRSALTGLTTGLAVGAFFGVLLSILYGLDRPASIISLAMFSAFSSGLRGFAGGIVIDRAQGGAMGLRIATALFITTLIVFGAQLVLPQLLAPTGIVDLSEISALEVGGAILSVVFWGLGIFAYLPSDHLLRPTSVEPLA